MCERDCVCHQSDSMGMSVQGETFSEWNAEQAQEELDYRVELNEISQNTLNEDLVEIEDEMYTIKVPPPQEHPPANTHIYTFIS
jgi:hypothetical protein